MDLEGFDNPWQRRCHLSGEPLGSFHVRILVFTRAELTFTRNFTWKLPLPRSYVIAWPNCAVTRPGMSLKYTSLRCLSGGSPALTQSFFVDSCGEFDRAAGSTSETMNGSFKRKTDVVGDVRLPR